MSRVKSSLNGLVQVGLVCFRLIGSNQLNQKLLTTINASGRLHMVGSGQDDHRYSDDYKSIETQRKTAHGWFGEDDFDQSVDSKVPASVNDFFVIRFAVCAEKANDQDIGKFGVAIVKLII